MGPPMLIGGNRHIFLDVGAGRGGFNGATDVNRWKLTIQRMNHAREHSFNGATDVNRWKQRHEGRRYEGWRHASMGPPMLIGGNSFIVCSFRFMRPRFNGATDVNRWKLIVGINF